MCGKGSLKQSEAEAGSIPIVYEGFIYQKKEVFHEKYIICNTNVVK